MKKTNTMTQGEFGDLYGVSQQQVSKYIASGAIPKSAVVRKGRYMRIKPVAAIEALAKNLDPGQRKRGAAVGLDNGLKDNDSFQKAKARAEFYKYLKRKRAYEEKHKRYILRADVRDQVTKAIKIFSDTALNSTHRIAAKVTPESDAQKCMVILNREITEMLKEMVRLLNASAK